MKKWLKYIILFIFALVYINIIPFDLDEIWNYGFAHSIYQGFIPYKDFNMVVTPFFPFLFSLPFHLFGSNMIIMNIEQSLLICGTYYLLEKLLKDKANIILIFLFINFDLLYASYNYFIFFLLLLLLFLEQENKNDYFVGLIIGLAILTKQSIGLCFALPSLYYLFKKDKKKVVKRIMGISIPLIIFGVYLIVSNSYVQFFDLCILGMFDFGRKNYVGNLFVILLVILSISFVLYLIKKNYHDIKNYYILSFLSIVIPMLDSFHIKFFLLACLILFFDKIKIKKLNLKLIAYASICGIIILTFFKEVERDFIYPNPISHFEYRYISKKHIQETQQVSAVLKQYKKQKCFYLFEQSYYYKIINDEKIDYFDLINTGNWGYRGSDKLKNALEKNKDAIFVINRNSYIENKQPDKVALNFVLQHGTKIKEVQGFEFYKIKN